MADERRARAALEERVGVLERRDEEKRARVERLEGAVRQIERVRGVLGGEMGEEEGQEEEGVEGEGVEGGDGLRGETDTDTDTDEDTDAEAEQGSEKERGVGKDEFKKQAKPGSSDEARHQDQDQDQRQHVEAADKNTKEEG